MLGGGDLALRQSFAGAHLRQAARFLVVAFVVAAFLVELEEAVELHHRAGGAQIEHARADLAGDVDGGALELGQLHLARDRAQPDQLVELGLLGLELPHDLARPARHVGRADRLVRLLRVLRLGLVAARRLGHVAVAIVGADDAARSGDRLVGDLHAVGTHIGNETDGLAADVDALVEPLRDAHGVGGREAELAARFLLQGRGGEGRLRVALARLGLDRVDGEGGGFERLLEGLGFRARADVEARDLLAVGADEARFEGVVPRRRQRCDQRPVFARDELLDLQLAVADEPQRHRLHPAGRARAGQLAPQHRRQREADEIVERAAGEIGVDQRRVDAARMLHRLGHRLLGDGVEHHALDGLRLERALLPQHLEHVPGDRLALAVRVGGEDELVGVLDRLGDVAQPLGGLGVDLPDHAEIRLRVDRAVLGGQIPHMAERGENLVASGPDTY